MYKVSTNTFSQELVFNHTTNKTAKGFLNKKPFDFNTAKITFNKYHLLKQQKGFVVKIVNSENSNFLVEVNGNLYNVIVKTPFDELLEKTKSADKPKDIVVKSNMPGKIVQIFVQVGDQINKGDVILVLEAMKMENSIKALNKGIVKNVFVNQNDIISKNSKLIELEYND